MYFRKPETAAMVQGGVSFTDSCVPLSLGKPGPRVGTRTRVETPSETAVGVSSGRLLQYLHA